ncbi:MAG: OmpA family protein [Desulfobacterales bacterium]|nr:OmpA family protein [Desulfobacterales bacterium]
MKPDEYNSYLINQDDKADWLITYADLMTLLMVFFVLLYSLASFEKERYKTTIAAVKVEVRKRPEMQGLMTVLGRPDGFDKKVKIDEITGIRNRDAALYRSMDRMVKNAAQKEHIALEASSGKMILTVSGEALFSSGSARLNPSALPGIDRMIDLFKEYQEYNINIKGHTDNVPIATKEFPSNWELSAIRATTVLKYLISKGVDPKRLTATGYADIISLSDNSTEENRAKNRRVEFVLEKSEANKPPYSR